MAKMFIPTTGGGNWQAAGRGQKPSWQVLVRLARYLPPLKYKLIAAALCMVVVSATSIGVAWIGKQLIDAINGGAKTGEISPVNLYAQLAVLILIAKGLFNYGQQY